MNKTILIPHQNLLPTYYFYRLLRTYCNSKLMKKKELFEYQEYFQSEYCILLCTHAKILLYYFKDFMSPMSCPRGII